MKALLLALAILLVGCLEQGAPGGSPTPSPSPSPSPTPIEEDPTIRSLASGSMAGTRVQARRVIADASEYEAFWADVREDPSAPAPSVDFARETVVAAVSEARPNACWALRVTNATADRVEVTTFSPPPDVMCASVITYPWHFVALSGAGRDPIFVESSAQGPPPS